MTSANTRGFFLRCSTCGSFRVQKYDADNLVKGGSKFVSEWGSDRITDGAYFCPSCEKYEMRFDAPLVLFD